MSFGLSDMKKLDPKAAMFDYVNITENGDGTADLQCYYIAEGNKRPSIDDPD